MVQKQINVGQDGKENTQINHFNLQPLELEVDPYVPPQPSAGGLFGRAEDLKQLHGLLQSSKKVCVVAGMGGVGKTELVRQYASGSDCKKNFLGGVFYIDARDRQDLAVEIVMLTQWKFKGELPANLSPKEKVTACWQAWKGQTEKVLLILDDVSGLAEQVKPYLPPSDLVTLRLLMTSRETPDKRIAEKLDLNVLSPTAARELLASIVGLERVATEPEQADLLCQELGYLPLALELVGYYLDEDYQKLSLSDMLGKLQEKVKHPSLSPEEVPLAMRATRGIQAAFDLSWDELKPEAKHLACVLGAFASAPIRWDLVAVIYSHLQGESFSGDDLKDRWLKSLRKLHLVLDVNSDIYDLHPLVRDYLNEQFKKHEDRDRIQLIFCEVFADVAENIDISSTLTTFNLIEPHLKRAIAWQEDRDPQFAMMLNGLAMLHQSQARYSEAETLFLRSLSILERQLGADHPDVATSFNNLGGLYRLQGKYSEAELLYLRSLEIMERQLGADHPDVAQSLLNLAALYHNTQRHSEALQSIKRAIQIYEQKLGTEHPGTQNALSWLQAIEETGKG